MNIQLVCAARPNFMKIAPLYHALRSEPWAEPVIVHTGQHYDQNMSDVFFRDLGLPEPDIHLGVAGGTHAEQTGRVMIAYERVLLDRRPDLVIVVGDVNSTAAAALAAAKLGITVAHLEAGLRSRDRTMPEEINRLVTDVLADMHWTPSRDASDNLLREGIPPSRIHFVGNIMIDSFEMLRDRIAGQETHRDFGLAGGSYGVVTLHRPSNVDDPATLGKLRDLLLEVAERLPLVFPIHPRTRKKLEEYRLLPGAGGDGRLLLPEPLSYIRFMSLVMNCRLVITDSGGLQEETSYLGIPCLTMRRNTERPVTVTQGTNRLCEMSEVQQRVDEIIGSPAPARTRIDRWDGQTAGRIVDIVRRLGNGKNGPARRMRRAAAGSGKDGR